MIACDSCLNGGGCRANECVIAADALVKHPQQGNVAQLPRGTMSIE